MMKKSCKLLISGKNGNLVYMRPKAKLPPENWIDSAYDAIYEPVQLELTAQDQVINYSGEMRIDAAAAFGNTLYIGERSNKANGSQACLYQLELGSDKPVKMEVQVPDGMDISMMTCDGKGNLCLLLTQSENGSFENVRSCLMEAFA